MRSLSTFTVLLLALMVTLAMLSYCSVTGATPVEAPSTSDVQDRKSVPPSVVEGDEYFVPIKEGEDKEMSSPIEVLKDHDDDDDDDDHHKRRRKCHCYWRCHHHRCWKVCRGKWCHRY
ncbi:hypothetical protein BGZ81_000493 [Podila clonocystis]|nr:hypothetical protein BGZ81_000493 [Podila clonocystis]